MICTPEAQNEVAGAIGIQPNQTPTPTWASPLYSCRLTYPDGVIVLSVEELPDLRATIARVDDLARQLGKRSVVGGLGQGAFDTPDDSMIVRKDNKILRIDMSGMPRSFGAPAIPRAEAATRVAIVIMGCWTGT